jgi:hypothetical protein
LQGALKTGGLGIDDNRRISFAAITPVARGRLRIEINDDRGGPGPFGGNGKREGKRGFAGAALLGDQCDCLHVEKYTYLQVDIAHI